jgi:hypothetical protein
MTTATHTHRGWSIVKYDTGGRRAGREITYTATKGTDRIIGHTLREVKASIDITEDMTPEWMAHAAAVAEMLRA